MKKEKIIKFLKALACKPVQQGSWIMSSCPLSYWTHTSGSDKHPSFGINIETNVVNCFTCGHIGKPVDLLYKIHQRNSVDPSGKDYEFQVANELITDTDDLEVSDNTIEDLIFMNKEKLIFPEEWLANFPPAYDHPYLATRKGGIVPSKLAEFVDIRFDSYRNRICLPLRDFEGRLRGLHGRTVIGEDPPYYVYTYKNQANPEVWYGEQWVDFSKTVVMTESVFDCLRVMQVYKNVVCPLRSGISYEKIMRLSSATDIILMLDNDKAGTKAKEKIKETLTDSYIVDLTKEIPEKDPGECTVEQVSEVLKEYVKINLDFD